MTVAKLLIHLKAVIPILAGTAVYAFGLLYFIIPNELMEGGVTGITVLLNYAFGVSPSLSTIIINVPIFLLGMKILGGQQSIYTGIGIVSLTFFLWILEVAIHSGWIVPFRTEQDYILASLYAGVTLGAGLGIVFRFGGTTGGSDIIARILNRRFGFSMGQVILGLDILIIGVSILYIPLAKILYTLVTVFIASRVIDFIQDGAYAAKAFTIISDQAPAIADKITSELDRGVTLIPVVGGYSREARQMAYCVVSRQEIRRLNSIAKSLDPRAFIIVSDVHDVHGEGFKEED
ncbi:YitT family protein [Paenibacillus sp. F411]|uniref:YitT family protein n=1 Tax=Paenibacillus sp. F411 TaxID=2820239 RepID=UPI001AAF6442|nr:YitT family protein [Paenibacillus sp. F411]